MFTRSLSPYIRFKSKSKSKNFKKSKKTNIKNKNRPHSLSSLPLSFNSLPRSPLKKMSITKTNQGEEGTCVAHTISRLIVKNIFERLYPLEMSLAEENLYEKNNCNIYLNTNINTKDRNAGYLDLTPTNCGQKGYYKILLFLYVYYIIRENFDCDGVSYLSSSYVLNLLFNTNNAGTNIMPKIFQQSFHLPILNVLLEKIKTIFKNKMNIKYEIVDMANDNDNNAIIIIRKLLDANLYVGVSLSPRYGDGHTATIVGHTPYHFVIKNSWNTYKDYIPYKYLNDHFKIGYMSYKINQYYLILPIYEKTERYDYALEGKNSHIYVNYIEIEKREMPEYKNWILKYVKQL